VVLGLNAPEAELAASFALAAKQPLVKGFAVGRPEPDRAVIEVVIEALLAVERPVIVAGGGVIYSQAEQVLLDFAKTHNIPLCETQAGKGAVDWEEGVNLGSLGVTGGDAANAARSVSFQTRKSRSSELTRRSVASPDPTMIPRAGACGMKRPMPLWLHQIAMAYRPTRR
jgi:hypothetical protein